MKFILASSSPRRKELLNLMGIDFEIIKPLNEEDMTQKMSYKKLSEVLSLQKAQEVFDKTSGDRIVIGSDSMVYINKTLLGKPKNKDDAYNMLKKLSNNTHKVVTGLSVLIEKDKKIKKYVVHDVSKVKFKKLSDEEINSYLALDEYKDKAGSYAVQGKSGVFIKRITGNMTTIIGLPTHKLYEILSKENLYNLK